MKGKEKKDLKLESHAEIGYLVGYDSTNIFRIYIPSRKEVRRVRDVTFCEESFFPKGNFSDTQLSNTKFVFIPHIPDESDEISIELNNSSIFSENKPTNQILKEELSSKIAKPPLEINNNSTTQKYENTRQFRSKRFIGKYTAFVATDPEYPTTSFHAAFQFSLNQKEKIHQKDLPPLPHFWSDLKNHPLRDKFMEAGKLEWNLLHERKTFGHPLSQKMKQHANHYH